MSSQGMLNLTVPSEGFRAKAYPDPKTGGAPWTIAYGHTEGVKEGDICTQTQGLIWLGSDMSVAEKCINDNVTAPLTQNQFDAIADFIYNVGVGNFLSSTLLKKLNAGDMTGASLEFNKWVRNALPGTIIRRQKETDWFNYGKVDTD